MSSNETDDGLTQQQHWETITVAIPGARDTFLPPPPHRARHRKPVSWQVKAIAGRFRTVTHRGGRRGA